MSIKGKSGDGNKPECAKMSHKAQRELLGWNEMRTSLAKKDGNFLYSFCCSHARKVSKEQEKDGKVSSVGNVFSVWSFPDFEIRLPS